MSRGNSVSATLRMGSSLVAAFCSTVVPAVEGEPAALMGVSAVDLGVPERMGPEAEQVLAAVLGPDFASSESRSEPPGSTTGSPRVMRRRTNCVDSGLRSWRWRTA